MDVRKFLLEYESYFNRASRNLIVREMGEEYGMGLFSADHSDDMWMFMGFF